MKNISSALMLLSVPVNQCVWHFDHENESVNNYSFFNSWCVVFLLPGLFCFMFENKHTLLKS
jgi:hypothetical protein